MEFLRPDPVGSELISVQRGVESARMDAAVPERSAQGAPERCLAVIPIRSFNASKTRLGGMLDEQQRSRLMRSLAAGVLAALEGLDTLVVTGDAEVAEWARSLDVAVLDPGTAGLDHAARAGADHAAALGFGRVAIVHADLAHPVGLAAALEYRHDVDAVVLADHHGTGTNVLIVPSAAPFEFAYGPGSFSKHCAESERLGLRSLQITGDPLGRDVDTPSDLEWLGRWDG